MVKSIEDRQIQLTRRRQYLSLRIDNIAQELDAPHSADWEESAVETENDEMLEDLGTAGQEELRAIDAALARIANGTYGLCVICGNAISEDRLDALPHTPFCKSHAPA